MKAILLTDKASIRTILNPGCLAAKDTQDTALPDLSAQVYIDPDREHRTYGLSAPRGLLAIDSQEGLQVFGAQGVRGRSNAQPGTAASHFWVNIDRTTVIRPDLDVLLAGRCTSSGFSLMQPRDGTPRDGPGLDV
jgi:hypothetical protein